jgi:hypothetical protein
MPHLETCPACGNDVYFTHDYDHEGPTGVDYYRLSLSCATCNIDITGPLYHDGYTTKTDTAPLEEELAEKWNKFALACKSTFP